MKFLLTTLHAKYVHASLALPYLAAATAGLDGVETVIREFTVNEEPERLLRAIAGYGADAVAFSCYIWNVEATLRLASDLKKVSPETVIVLGGPEASFGVFEMMERHPAIDFVIRGEGEETFRELAQILARPGRCGDAPPADSAGVTFRADGDIIANPERDPIADLDGIPSPFAAGLVDLSKPLVYVETSRGCPFSCAFCMSSLEQGVRSFSMVRIAADLEVIMAAGVATIKLVDRTFNYDAGRANAIWEFILGASRQNRFHFEIAADLLTDANFALLRSVPPGMFRFEIGVQSGEAETLARVGRKSDLERLAANVRRLVAETGVIVHLDLVAGLPGEDYAGFLDSLQQVFDLLQGDADVRRGLVTPSDETDAPSPLASRPRKDHVIQVELLKVLKGSPMRKIAVAEGYAFSDTPPYQILRTPWLSFAEIGRIAAIARYLDLFYNSGRFAASLALLARLAPLSRFFDFCAGGHGEVEVPAGLSRHGSAGLFWRFAERFAGEQWREDVRDVLCFDYCRSECPVAGKLPDFFGGEGAWGKGRDDLFREEGIAPGSRVRVFRRRFNRDYRLDPWSDGAVILTFVYASAPDQGLRVLITAQPPAGG